MQHRSANYLHNSKQYTLFICLYWLLCVFLRLYEHVYFGNCHLTMTVIHCVSCACNCLFYKLEVWCSQNSIKKKKLTAMLRFHITHFGKWWVFIKKLKLCGYNLLIFSWSGTLTHWFHCSGCFGCLADVTKRWSWRTTGKAQCMTAAFGGVKWK